MPPSNCDSQLSIRSITVVNNFVTNCALNTHWNLLKEITQESNKKFMHVLHTKKNLIVRTVLMMMLEKSTDNFVMSCKWAREDEKIFGKQVNKVFVAAAFLSQFYESLKYIFYGTLHFAASYLRPSCLKEVHQRVTKNFFEKVLRNIFHLILRLTSFVIVLWVH